MNTDSTPKSNMQKVALTALAGTSIEWYDFFLYGAAAALIFPTAFFGEATPSTALILSLLTFAAALLWKDYGIFWVSVYIAFASLLTLLSVMALTETYLTDLNDKG